MRRPPYWKKNTNDLDLTSLRIQKLTNLFGEALVADLSAFLEENPSCTQYMGDLLLASHDQEKCW
jgi:hypothetical protein